MAANIEDALLAGYFFYGEEGYLADEFLDDLKRLLTDASGGEFHLTRMDLDEAKWPDIVDAARTAPFLFEPWRAIVVRVPDKKSGAARGGGASAGATGPAGGTMASTISDVSATATAGPGSGVAAADSRASAAAVADVASAGRTGPAAAGGAAG